MLDAPEIQPGMIVAERLRSGIVKAVDWNDNTALVMWPHTEQWIDIEKLVEVKTNA